MRVDTIRRRATPEGIHLNLRVAGPTVRLFAWGIDAILMLVAQSVIALLGNLLGELGVGFWMLSAFLITWFYPVAFEVYRTGTTPGKSIFGLQVVHDDGTPVGLSASLLRNLLRFADFLPMAYGAGLVSMLLSPDAQRLGDLAAGTLVVYREDFTTYPSVADERPVPPPIALDLREQRAVIDFGLRLDSWTLARQAELAEIVEPLAGARGEAGVSRLLGIANWLLGRRHTSRGAAPPRLGQPPVGEGPKQLPAEIVPTAPETAT